MIYVYAFDQNKGINIENELYKGVDIIYILFVGTITKGRMLPWHDIDLLLKLMWRYWLPSP